MVDEDTALRTTMGVRMIHVALDLGEQREEATTAFATASRMVTIVGTLVAEDDESLRPVDFRQIFG